MRRALTCTWIWLLFAPAPAAAAPGGRTPSLRVTVDGDEIIVRFRRMQGEDDEWIGLAPVGSPARENATWHYTDGRRDGRLTFHRWRDARSPPELPAGEYVARAYRGGVTYEVLAASGSFRLPEPPPRACTLPSRAQIDAEAEGGTAVVHFRGLCGAPYDWIAIAEVCSRPDETVVFAFTHAMPEGFVRFEGLRPGVYVARAFHDHVETRTFEVRAESAVFRVEAPR